jgi:hypothetical protein
MLKRTAAVLGSLTLSVALVFACASNGSGGDNSPGIDSSIASQDSGAGEDTSAMDSAMPDTNLAVDTGSMGIVPTTCAQVDGTFGCCGPNEENYYCGGDAGTVSSKGCGGETTEAGVALVCGWNTTKGYYGCVTPPASADPSGAHPLACGASAGDSGTTLDSGIVDSGTPGDSGGDSGTITDSGTPGDGGGGGTPTTCAQAYNVIGCCGANGDNYYCPADGGALTMTACTAPKVCGWNATKGYYACVAAPGTADPSGTNPIACQ